MIPKQELVAGLATAAVAWALVSAPAPSRADDWKVSQDHSWCDEGKRNSGYCEVREITLPAGRDLIEVDAERNGGISVRGVDGDQIRIVAKVQLWDVRRDEGPELAQKIEIDTDGVIRPHGPRGDKWGVSFRIEVPRSSNLELVANNGGIEIHDVHGEIGFETHNGGVHLSSLAGSVEGFTRNGGLEIDLDGSTWDGQGLNVETTNGGIELGVPEDYSASLVTGTVNGRLRVDFPVRVEGDLSRRIRTELGKGGPLIRVVTTNGGVDIREL